MPTYPLTFPSVGIVQSTFGLQTASGAQRSPFTLRTQVYLSPGKMWFGTVTFKKVTFAQAASIRAFLADLQGQYGTFLYGDPDYLARGASGIYSGTPVVNGAGQTGNTLNIDGATNSITGWAKAGDYFQIGSGTSARLYMITQDANSNGSGEVVLTFQPALRSSPSDGATITFTGAKGLMRLAENTSSWDSDMSSINDITLSFHEASSE